MPNKVKKIQGLERPSDVKGIRSFLGLTGYYRRFIPEYAHRSQPIDNAYPEEYQMAMG